MYLRRSCPGNGTKSLSLRLSSFNFEIKEPDLAPKSTPSAFCDAEALESEGGSGQEVYISLVNLEFPKCRML